MTNNTNSVSAPSTKWIARRRAKLAAYALFRRPHTPLPAGGDDLTALKAAARARKAVAP
jgi:hypothetical protein